MKAVRVGLTALCCEEKKTVKSVFLSNKFLL